MAVPTTKKFVVLSGRAADLESLEEECKAVANAYYNQGIYDIRVRIYITQVHMSPQKRTDYSKVKQMINEHFLYISKCDCVGVDKKSNRYVTLHKGTNRLINYAIAYWKYDHARASTIKWNTITYHTDGYDFDQPETDLDDAVAERARLDYKDGIMWKIGREITNILYRMFVGSRDPKGMDKSDKSGDTDSVTAD